MLHEYAHVRRRDDWMHLLQQVLQAVCFVHPGVIWFGRLLRLEREIACDEWVIARTGEPDVYARCLMKLAAFELGAAHHVTALQNATGQRGQLTQRVERLLRAAHVVRPRFAVLPIAGAAALVLVLVIHLVRLPPQFVMETGLAAASGHSVVLELPQWRRARSLCCDTSNVRRVNPARGVANNAPRTRDCGRCSGPPTAAVEHAPHMADEPALLAR